MKLLLIDLPSVLHPIFHMSGKEPDPNYTSQQTVARIHQLALDHDHVAVCCDSPKSVRKELDPNYKANRPERDERLIHQLRLAKEQLLSDGLPVWTVEGFEADDVIASAVEKAVNAHVHKELALDGVTIVSADKDLLQLVSPEVSVLTPNGKTYGPSEVFAKFGVRPDQMRDYLILVGDSSDNVKGVDGIGPVKAKDLLAACGSIVGIFERVTAGKVIDRPFTPSIVTALQEHGVHGCELGRKLVQLHDELEIPFDEILKPRTPAQGDDMSTQVIDNKTGEVTDVPSAPSSPPPAPATVMNGATEAKKDEPSASLQLATVEWSRELEPRSLQQAERVANHMFASRLFAAYGTREGVLATILAGRELGVGAMASLRGFHIIEGKPAMSSGLMAALILQSGKARYFRCVKSTNDSATFRTHRIGDDEPVEVTFTMADAERAGLIKDKSGWKKFPADMVVARAIARLARLVYPDVCFGLYTPEELGREDLEMREAA